MEYSESSISSNTISRVRVGRYVLGQTLGEGYFSTVKLARHIDTGDNVAIKIFDKHRVLANQPMHVLSKIERNLSIMKMIRHPNVVHMYEVIYSKTRFFIVLELVTGGELFDKITNAGGRLTEPEARKYFQQLIHAVDYCHSKGVSHKNLKPENLLVDDDGVLKVLDFGLSMLSQQVGQDGLLHTACGMPHYTAPEDRINMGYEDAKSDIWSCGVILFVLLAGHLPFKCKDTTILCLETFKADIPYPSYFSQSVKRLIERILDPNPATRIAIKDILEDEWFKNEPQPPRSSLENISSDKDVVEGQDLGPAAPVTAFQIMHSSLGFSLVGNLLNKVLGKRETSFVSKCSPNELISGIERTIAYMGFNVKKRNYKLKIEGEQNERQGHLSIAIKIVKVDPSFSKVEVLRAGGNTLDFDKFYRDLSVGLQGIIWEEKPTNTKRDGASTSTAK